MLTIHGVPISVHTRKPITVAILKGIAFETVPVIPFDPPRDWRRLSPTGLIPAISHDGYELAESSAICAYLERIAPQPALYPEDPKAYGRALWLEQYATNVLFRTVIHPLFFQRIIRPLILREGAPDEAEVDRVQGSVAPDVLGYLENAADANGFVYGSLTIADIAIVSNLINYHYLGFRLDAERFPRLAALFSQAIRNSPFRTALAHEQPFAEKMELDRSFLT